MNLYDIVTPMTMAEAKTDYQKKRERERDIDAGRPVAKPRQPQMTDYQKRRAQQKKEMELGENAWSDGANAWSSEHNNWTAEDSSDFMAADSTSPVGGNMQFEEQLHVGDPVVVTAPTEFEGKTGEISEFSPSGKFVIVRLYNHGRHSMHLSDVAYNQYAADQEQDDWYDDEEVDEGFQDFNRVEPYAVCLAGKPVKKFDYYQDARRFHDNWKKKLYNAGEKAKADTITLMPLNLEEGFFGDMKQSFATGMVDKLKKAIPAEHHKHYNFDSVKSPSDTKAMVARARAAGHLKESGVAEGDDDNTNRLEMMRSEYAKAHKILNKFGNANMGRIEVMRLLLDNGISQKTANIFASKRSIKEQGVAEGSNDTYDIIRTNDYGKKDFFAGNYSLEQAKDELAKCLAHPLHTKYGHKFAIVKRNEQPIKEFAPGGTMKPPAPPTAKKKDPFEDDDRSQLLMSIKNLLDKGAKIDSYLFGARGHITGVSNDYFGFYFKKLNKPHSKSSFVRPMDGEDDESYMLKLVKPGYYQLWDKSIADAGEQGVAEASYINGHVEDPESLRWKQTSMSYEQAVAKFGKNNVKQDGKNRLGQKIVMVLVPLGEQGVAEAVPAQASGVDPKIQFLQPTIQFAEKMGYRVTLNPQGRVVAKLVNKQLGHIVHIGLMQPSGKGFEVSMADNLDKQTNAWSAKELAQDFKGWYAQAVKDQDFNNGYNEKPQLEQQGVAEAGPNAPYTPSPAKPFRNPRGFNKQGTGVGNKLADLNRKEWEEKKKKEQGVAEGRDDTKNKLFVKKLASEQSLIEHAKLFAKNLQLDGVPVTSKNRYTVVCSTIFAHDKKAVNESSHITNGKQLIQLLKQLDQFSQLPIKVGSSVAIINSQLQGDSVELWGFTSPKTISKIYRDSTDNSIRQFEFNNDPQDVWPKTDNAEYNGKFLMYSAFFGDKKSADHALTMLMLQGSGDLTIRNHITEQQYAAETYTDVSQFHNGSRKYSDIPSKPERQKQNRVPLRTFQELCDMLGVDRLALTNFARQVTDFPKPVPGIGGRKTYYRPQEFMQWAKDNNVTELLGKKKEQGVEEGDLMRSAWGKTQQAKSPTPKPAPVKESYWTKLQNERNTKLNTLVDELKESIKK